MAYDLVYEHFRVLNEIGASESVVDHPQVARPISQENTSRSSGFAAVRGVSDKVTVFQIP